MEIPLSFADLRKLGTWGRSTGAGSLVCWSGHTHGVTESGYHSTDGHRSGFTAFRSVI